ncbi:MAG: hypothetical protein H7308_15895, partial [Chthonomonadaceae bacterium]|nr:hypothetical protein [Chthonomonadaceae bacterium]
MKMKEGPGKVTKTETKSAPKSARSTRKMNPTKNELTPEIREQMVTLLNTRLADSLDMLTQTK